MLLTSKAIVLSTIKYSDADLIVKCYTQKGVKSYLIKRIFSQKKKNISPAFFSALSLLEITANYRPNKSLHFIKEVRIFQAYKTIGIDPIKQTLAIFLSEVLSHALKEEEENNALFSFLETALIWLDTHDQVANFHLLFLIELSKFLGFYPETSPQGAYFSLEGGKFSDSRRSPADLTGENLSLFKSLLGTNFDVLDQLKLNKQNRQQILESLIHYFELHLPGFRKPRSLEVLKTVFN